MKVFSPPLFTKSLNKLIPALSKCQNFEPLITSPKWQTRRVCHHFPLILWHETVLPKRQSTQKNPWIHLWILWLNAFLKMSTKKSPRNPHPISIHFKFWAVFPVFTFEEACYNWTSNRISYSTKTTIVRGVVATMGGYSSYQPKTTVGVPVAGGKPLPFRPWFLFGSNLPQTLDPYVSQLESNISKLPLWQFWFYHSGLCNLHPKLCVFVVFWWFGIRKFSWISKHPGLDLLQSNRFLP